VADRLVIGGQLGDYLIESVVGRGGMSVVYRARHSRLGMLVALKVLAPELSADDVFRERFLREAQMAASMDHPNVIPIHDMGLHEDSLYIILRYVAGGDLKGLLSTTGPIEMERALALLTPVGAALDAAHTRGLIHRDVKPANILIQRSDSGRDEHVYLTDFGIAKSASFDIGLTKSGASVGTLGYMAPEQFEGQAVSAQTDVYALAATLHECLVGRVPFRHELAEGARPSHGELEPPSALRPDLPPSLDTVLRQALAKDPSVRQASCDQLLRSCRDTLADRVSPAPVVAGAVLTATQPSVDAERSDNVPSSQPAVAHEVAPAPAADAVGPPAEPPSGDGGDELQRKRLASHRRRNVLVAVGVPLVVAGAAVGIVFLTSSSTAHAGKHSAAALGDVPTNHVTGYGAASVWLNGSQAEVTVDTTNLDHDASLVHLMHIHAGGRGECPPASAAQLHNGHLAISTTNGIKYYGPPVQALTTRGDTSPASILAFPRYLTGGNLSYTRTITLPAAVAREIRNDNAVIVVHGIDYDGSGIYSGVLDRSELNASVPGTATAPALCGKLLGTSTNPASASASGRTLLYTASLQPSAVAASEVFVCDPALAAAVAEEARRRAQASSTSAPSA
jgi:serine/threonine protein kinase